MTIERIDYQAGSVTGKGALIWHDKVSGTRPLLLMMTNWLSVTENATKRAQQMASDKYVAFVGCMPANLARVDDGDGADRVEGRKRVNAALATMVAEANKRGIGDSSKKAAVGFCFGGGNVLELALGAAILCRTGSSRVSRAVRISQILFSN